MARDHARVNVTIWNSAEFRQLPPDAQALYLTLWTAPGLSYCGVHDWRPCRLAALSGGSTAESIRATAAVLVERHFLVIDEDTEEVLVRSWMRFDGLLKQPRMAVSCVAAYAEVASATIRAVVVSELHRIMTREPDLACWSDSRVRDAMHQPALSVEDLAAGVTIGTSLPLPSPNPTESLAQTQGEVSPPPYSCSLLLTPYSYSCSCSYTPKRLASLASTPTA